MKNKFYDYYKDIPSWAKGIVVVGGIAIFYFAAKSFLSRIKESAEKNKAMETVNNQKEEEKQLQKLGLRASFPDSQYKAWADALQNQFDGCDISLSDISIVSVIWKSFTGTNSAKKLVAIISNFKNDLDYLKFSTAWGIRTYDQCGWWTGDVVNATLSKAVSDELNETEIGKINAILSKTNIKYRF
jgi:hypothetical protein